MFDCQRACDQVLARYDTELSLFCARLCKVFKIIAMNMSEPDALVLWLDGNRELHSYV